MGKMGEVIYDENGKFVEVKLSLEACQWIADYLMEVGEAQRLTKLRLKRERQNKENSSDSKVS